MRSPRQRVALLGGALIAASGLLSIWVGGRAGYLLYEPDPGGVFGHVGVLAGAAAIVVGSALIWLAHREATSPIAKLRVGILTIVLGHLGAVAGALLVGTAGLLLSYLAGIWLTVQGVRAWRWHDRPA